jgi:hypothetical protein
MTPAPRPRGRAVAWLFAQSMAFGLWAALLGIVANAMFLEAYGAKWLPVTYIAIAITGVIVSGAVSRAARRYDVVRIATVVLGGAAILQLAAWVIAAGTGSAWVSAPLLVLFPILIHLGFVFIGGQAGRILDIAGIKASFPRIMAGFPIGAIAGGLLGPAIVAAAGRTEHLLLPTALAEGAFAVMAFATGRRFRGRFGVEPAPPVVASLDDAGEALPAGRSFRRLAVDPFVALIALYVVLSALANQLADYLVMDRAAARYPKAEDLAVFVSAYTAAMNAVILVFLLGMAGALLRRFGLRLGITVNAVVVTAFALAMVVVFAVAGGTSFALLVVASATQIANLALSDGTTRTSLNAIYQVLPERMRLSVQAAVEGAGFPIAIGISGVLIIVLNLLPFALPAILAALAIVAGAWTAVAVRLYRAYAPALSAALGRRAQLDEVAAEAAIARDAASVGRLLASPDTRSARLGVELLAEVSSPLLANELAGHVDDPRADVRIAALVGLARAGDADAMQRLAEQVASGASSADPGIRRRAAEAAVVLGSEARAAVHALLADGDPSVRRAALDAVQVGDDDAVDLVVRALDDPSTAGPAAAAIARLGDAVVPVLDVRLTSRADAGADAGLVRLVCASGAGTAARDSVLARHIAHPDRELGRLVMERLVRRGPAPDRLAVPLDAVLVDDLRHAGRILAALQAVEGLDGPVERALADELDLVRRRVAVNRLARLGEDRLGSALLAIREDGERHGLAVEALEVAVGQGEARRLLAALDPAMAPGDARRALDAHGGAGTTGPAGRDAVLRDLVEDADGAWRSPWLRACAIRAARRAGVLGGFDVAAARAVHDPVIEEELAAAA